MAYPDDRIVSGHLDEGTVHAWLDGQLSAGHARALLGTPDRNFQEALARRAVAEDLSVRTVEGHLQRVYEKLGISNRRELARALSDKPAI